MIVGGFIISAYLKEFPAPDKDIYMKAREVYPDMSSRMVSAVV